MGKLTPQKLHDLSKVTQHVSGMDQSPAVTTPIRLLPPPSTKPLPSRSLVTSMLLNPAVSPQPSDAVPAPSAALIHNNQPSPILSSFDLQDTGPSWFSSYLTVLSSIPSAVPLLHPNFWKLEFPGAQPLDLFFSCSHSLGEFHPPWEDLRVVPLAQTTPLSSRTIYLFVFLWCPLGYLIDV